MWRPPPAYLEQTSQEVWGGTVPSWCTWSKRLRRFGAVQCPPGALGGPGVPGANVSGGLGLCGAPPVYLEQTSQEVWGGTVPSWCTWSKRLRRFGAVQCPPGVLGASTGGLGRRGGLPVYLEQTSQEVWLGAVASPCT